MIQGLESRPFDLSLLKTLQNQVVEQVVSFFSGHSFYLGHHSFLGFFVLSFGHTCDNLHILLSGMQCVSILFVWAGFADVPEAFAHVAMPLLLLRFQGTMAQSELSKF